MGNVNDLVGSELISARVRKEIASIQEANSNSKVAQSTNVKTSSKQSNAKSNLKVVASNVFEHLNNLI